MTDYADNAYSEYGKKQNQRSDSTLNNQKARS